MQFLEVKCKVQAFTISLATWTPFLTIKNLDIFTTEAMVIETFVRGIVSTVWSGKRINRTGIMIRIV